MELASLLLACSGPGAGRAIATNTRMGFYCAILAAVLTVAIFCLYRFRFGRSWPVFWSLFFLAFHPAWTVSATRGDCGAQKATLSGLVSIALVAFFFVQLYFPRRPGSETKGSLPDVDSDFPDGNGE